MSAVRNMFGAFAVLLPLDFKFMSVDQPWLACLIFNIFRSQPVPYRCHSLSQFFSPMAQQPLVGQGLLIIVAPRSHAVRWTAPPVGRTSLDEWSARCRDLYLTTYNTHKRQISMPAARFELAPTPRGHWDRLILSQSRTLITWSNIVCSVCYFILS